MGTLKDVSLAEAGKWGTLNEYAFFDKVRYNSLSQEIIVLLYIIFLISQPKHTLWVLKRTVSMRWIF